MEKVNILIIGAGVVGLAIAQELSRFHPDVVITEKEDSFGRHTSSRNSEVIHSGIYYPQGTLKADLCLKGNQQLYQFAEEYHIPYRKTGKLVVATSEEDLPALYRLYENGEKNHVKDLTILDEKECKNTEPRIKAIKGLWVPSTGIIDTHALMKEYVKIAEIQDAFIIYDMEVSSIKKTQQGFLVGYANGEEYFCNILINCSGLFSDKISALAGIDISEHKLKLHWCKGEYYKSTSLAGINHLVYPLPDPRGIFLGIHLTINLNGEVRFGPNAYYVNEINYSMQETHKEDFCRAINKYLSIELQDIHADDTGIRPKLQGPDDDFRDFYIREESDKGVPGFINLVGIESPGLTSAPAIAEKVCGIVADYFSHSEIS